MQFRLIAELEEIRNKVKNNIAFQKESIPILQKKLAIHRKDKRSLANIYSTLANSCAYYGYTEPEYYDKEKEYRIITLEYFMKLRDSAKNVEEKEEYVSKIASENYLHAVCLGYQYSKFRVDEIREEGIECGELARRTFKRLLKKDKKHLTQYVDIIRNLYIWNRKAKRLDVAENYFNEGMKESEKYNNEFCAAKLKSAKVTTNCFSKEYAKNFKELEYIIPVFEKNNYDTTWANYYFGVSYEGIGKIDKANECYLKSVRRTENEMGGLEPDGVQTNQEMQIGKYKAVINTAYKLRRYEDVFGYVELSKSRYLNEVLKIDDKQNEKGGMTPVSISQIQSISGPDTAILEYYAVDYEFGDYLILIVIDKKSFKVHKIDLNKKELKAHLREYKSFLEKSEGNFWLLNDKLAELYEVLLKPAYSRIRNKKRLMIIPHGGLHFFPFHLLRKNGRYVIEDFEVNYLPYAGIILQLKEKKRKKISPESQVLIVKNPGTEFLLKSEEAEKICKLFRKCKKLEGEKASFRNFRKYCRDAELIHFAGHSVFNEQDAMDSGLKLYDEKLRSTGTFKIRDIFGLDLGRSSLVVLSSCQSGVGDVMKSDNIIGMTRSFFSAGATSLILTYRNVEDINTGRIMSKFYEFLARSGNEPGSLRKAQEWAIKEEIHPRHWSAFFFTGDWR